MLYITDLVKISKTHIVLFLQYAQIRQVCSILRPKNNLYCSYWVGKRLLALVISFTTQRFGKRDMFGYEMVGFVDVYFITILYVLFEHHLRAYIDRPVSQEAEERTIAYYRMLRYPM